ncbi:site-2 protease family protein [Candidatus Daviesbacteria bacterium]|nr:site-2 protease family protein [Candidatus Daviesbacteria bacterium]
MLSLSILVLIHELGHFLMAKKFGIKVLEFGFGIPPRAWGKKIGETIVSLNWLPLGGFVHLLGEDEVDKKVLEDKRSFASQTVSKRIIVVAAGVLMNLFLAWILYTILLAAQNFKYEMKLPFPYQFAGVVQTNEEVVLIGDVAKDSPAFLAGIKKGDRVIALDNEEIKNPGDLIAKTKQKAGREIILTLSNEAKSSQRKISVTPRKTPPPNQGALGVAIDSYIFTVLEYRDLWQKILAGPIQGFNVMSVSFDTIGRLASVSLAQRNPGPVSESFGGPVAIGYFFNIILNEPDLKLKLLRYLDITAGISLSLAFFNVLPIPALDGGRLFFLLIEAVTRKKVNAEIEKKIHAVGMVVLLALFALVTFKDINTFILPEVGKLIH